MNRKLARVSFPAPDHDAFVWGPFLTTGATYAADWYSGLYVLSFDATPKKTS